MHSRFFGLGLSMVAWLGMAGPAVGQEAAPAPAKAIPIEVKPPEVLGMDVLLRRVREKTAAEQQEDAARVAEYRSAMKKQEGQTLHTEGLARREEALSQELEAKYTSNEALLIELDERLTERIGQMGELFGVVRLVATDLSGDVYTSLTSLGEEPRVPLLDKLGRNAGLPSTEDMQKLWYELLREMTAQGQVITQSAEVVVEAAKAEEGKSAPPPVTETRTVVRAGPFTAISEGEYVSWAPDFQKVEVLERQPPTRYVGTIAGFESGGSGFRRLAVDPSQGVLLSALTGTPSLVERVNQGGYVGYTIVLLGLTALALGLLRMGVLAMVTKSVSDQTGRDTASPDNPLGRLLSTYQSNRDRGSETLEMKLDESLRNETAGVERYLWVVQTISIIAPLLGLLGTVTGMIQTFQMITLFGAGDPKIMAGGISEALVTTTLGLVTAIPLVLLHALLASRAGAVVEILEERRTALIAEHLESERVAA